MIFLKKNLCEVFLVIYGFTIPVISFAAGTIDNPLASKGIDSVPKFIEILLTGLLRVGIPVVALAVIYCGFLFVSARGNPEKLKKAKDALLYTLIGAAILLGSWAIAHMISATVLAL